VRRRSEDEVLSISWSDGHRSDYPYPYLRGWCPCAVCQGHGSERHFVDGVNHDLKSIRIVGTYALSLTWGDGHETGIYSYRYLREICPCPSCAGSGLANAD
jgi:DUF971 family protein